MTEQQINNMKSGLELAASEIGLPRCWWHRFRCTPAQRLFVGVFDTAISLHDDGQYTFDVWRPNTRNGEEIKWKKVAAIRRKYKVDASGLYSICQLLTPER